MPELISGNSEEQNVCILSALTENQKSMTEFDLQVDCCHSSKKRCLR
ncbi:hypothetical protein [Lactococcus protaetiae]|nr:hypothetical protein [Lactococcus protaetiae]